MAAARQVVVVLVTVPTSGCGRPDRGGGRPRAARREREHRPGPRSVFHWEDLVRTEARVRAAMPPYAVPAFLARPVVTGHESLRVLGL